jgi:hypothetical protein
MRITIVHTKGREWMIQTVDRAFDDTLRTLAHGALKITNPHKSWQGSTMTFSLTAALGFLKNPISGTVEVSDHEVTVNADIGMLSKLIPPETIQTTLESRLRGLLA